MYEKVLNMVKKYAPEVIGEEDNDIFFYPEYFEKVFLPEFWGDENIEVFKQLIADSKTISKVGLSGVLILSQKEKKLFATSIEAHSGKYH